MRVQVLQGALENTATLLAATQSDVLQLAQEEDEDSEDYTLFDRGSNSTLGSLRSARVVSSKLHHILRDMKSRSLSLDPEILPQFEKCGDVVSHIFGYFGALGDSAVRLINEDSQTHSFAEVLTAMRRTSASYLKAESTDLFYTPLRQLKSLTDAMNELHSMASEFSNLTEFERPQPPWIIRSKELQNRKAISAVAEEEIKNLKRDLQDRATLLKLRQQDLEEANMKIELLDKRAKDANKKLDHISDLEQQMKVGKEKVNGLEKALESQTLAAQKAEEERDRWMRKASEVSSTNKPGDNAVRGIELVGSSAEMEWLKSEIQILQSTNRYLRQQFRRNQTAQDQAANSWLSTPLRVPGKREDRSAGLRAALSNIALLPLNSKPVKVQGRQKNVPPKQTPRYQLIEQEIKRLKALDGIGSFGGRGTLIAGIDLLPEPLSY
jgi:dynactin 1